MSFGYSVGDCMLLVQLAYKTVQNARKACGAHDAICHEVTSLHVVLKRVESEARKPDSLLSRAGNSDTKELDTLLSGCRAVLSTVSQMLEKYNALSAEKRSVTKLWQKVRFGNGKMLDLATIRGEISTYTHAITLFLNLLSMGSQGKVEVYMESHGNELREIKSSLHLAIARLDARNPDNQSVLTTYAGDDKAAWREFRRELIQDGYSYRQLMKHKETIKAYIWELADRGVLDDADPQEEQDERNTASVNLQETIQRPDESDTIYLPTNFTPGLPSVSPEKGESSKQRDATNPEPPDIQVSNEPFLCSRLDLISAGEDTSEDPDTNDDDDEADVSGYSSDELHPSQGLDPQVYAQPQRRVESLHAHSFADRNNKSEAIRSESILQSARSQPQPGIPISAIPRKPYQAYAEDEAEDDVVPQAESSDKIARPVEELHVSDELSKHKTSQVPSRQTDHTPRREEQGRSTAERDNKSAPEEVWPTDSEYAKILRRVHRKHTKTAGPKKSSEDKPKEVPFDYGRRDPVQRAIYRMWDAHLANISRKPIPIPSSAEWGSASEYEGTSRW